MEWFDADIGSLQTAFELAPEVFKPVGVDLSFDVLFGVVSRVVGIRLELLSPD
jgi:hypothetical protein